MGDLRVPHERRGAGSRDEPRSSTRSSSTARCCSTGTRSRRGCARSPPSSTPADEVRIVGEKTDLTLSLAGRRGTVEDGHINMPGGEVFYSPVEDSVSGVVTFCEFPAVYFGHEVTGSGSSSSTARSSRRARARGEEFLLRTLDTDEGARRLGELGIGCNPGIQRFTKNVGFDEKIDGTIHLAVGNSYTSTGGTNARAFHWDIVKDLRQRRTDLRRRPARAGRRGLAGLSEPQAVAYAAAISPASRAFATISSRFALERAAAAFAVEVGEHERRHRLAAHPLVRRRRRAPARSAARRRRGSRRADVRAAARLRRAPSAPRRSRAAPAASSTRAETGGPPWAV